MRRLPSKPSWWLEFSHKIKVWLLTKFSPVAKHATICLICALAAITSFVMDRVNVITSFFYESLEK